MKPTAPVKFILRRPTSGIDLIEKCRKPLAELSQDELQEFARRIEADKFTYQRYERDKSFFVGDLLAVHHYLDPAVLGLNRTGRLRELKRAAYALLPSSTRLLNFVAAVPPMLQDIHQGKLVCVKVKGNLLQSFTTPEQFKSYVVERRLYVYPQRARKKSSPVVPASLPPELRDMWEAWELWKTVDQGGTVIPGCCSTEPDLVQFFVDRGRYSVHQSTVLASIFRPSYAHIGRRPKEPGHGSVFPGSVRSMRKA